MRQNFCKGDVQIDQILSDGPVGLKFIAGGSGLLEMLNLDNQARYRMLQSLSDLEGQIDYLLVDTPAGASDSTLFFASACAIPVVVLVAEPTSFLDAYSLIKAAHIDKSITNFSVLVNMADNSASAKKILINFLRYVDAFWM